MMRPISRRERTLVGLGLLVGAGVLAWELLIAPAREREHAAAELIPVREQLLVRRQELVARRPVVAGEIEEVDGRLADLATRFLGAGTPAVAAAELQRIVKDMAAQAVTEVRSERILPPVERGELLEIPIEIAVSGEIRQLVDLLARLEQAPKLLTVHDLKLRVVNVAQPKDLLATLTLSGFILAAGTKA